MTRSSGPGVASRAVAGADRLWPLLAGAMAGVALIGIEAAYGAAATVLIPIGSWAGASVLLYGALAESGMSFAWSVRWGLRTAAVLVVALGLTLVSPLVAMVSLGVAAATSPPVTERLLRLQQRAATRADQAAVDRTFTRLVAGLERRPEG